MSLTPLFTRYVLLFVISCIDDSLLSALAIRHGYVRALKSYSASCAKPHYISIKACRHVWLGNVLQDALTLQRICLEKKAELSHHEDKNNVPDVKQMVQQLMTNLFVATYNHSVSFIGQIKHCTSGRKWLKHYIFKPLLSSEFYHH